MDKSNETSLLSVRNLYKRFDISGGMLDQIKFENGKFKREKTLVKALNNISIEINKGGETFSVVGESGGCGKSTLGRTIMGGCILRTAERYITKGGSVSIICPPR